MNITTFLKKGLNKTLKLINGTNFSYAGPWVTVQTDTVVDSWYVGDFMSADYTIAVDGAAGNREILKCLVVASPQVASATIYGRTNTSANLISINATVNDSKLVLTASANSSPVKVIFSASYYQTLNQLEPA